MKARAMYAAGFDTTDNSPEVLGGKGRSLSRLAGAGFDVPDGFVVTTFAYRDFVEASDLNARILDLAKPQVVEGIVSFEKAAKRIQELFDEHDVGSGIRSEISAAYDALGDRPAVAVRSSATAEDSPDASFAGQHETHLNVRGAAPVVAAVKDCWGSLWTAQAMRYRHERSMEHEDVAMGVVVQIMVPSEVSGIAFTANPASGERSEMIVNCSFGLGEAVVGGEVTPDTYVVDRGSLTAKDTVTGSKERMIVADGEQGTRTEAVRAERRGEPCLSDAAVADLAALALTVEDVFDGEPQDIEWALSSGKLWLLQSRPITNLPPDPPKDVTWPEIPGAQLLKRQVAENMPDPLSPLFEDLYLRAIFDMQTWPEGWEWKGRLTRNWMKNFVVTTVNGYAYQPLYKERHGDWEEHMQKTREEQKKLPWHVNLRRAIKMPSWMIGDMKGGPLHVLYLLMTAFRTFRKFPAIVTWEKRQLPDYLAAVEAWQQRDPAQATNAELLRGMKSLTMSEANYWQALRSVIGTAKITDGAFQKFLEENAPDEGFISGTFLSGFSSRTLDAEFAMRAIAEDIRADSSLYELALLTPAPRLLDAIKGHSRGAPVGAAIDRYLHDYGRQVFNLDFVEPSLAEAPLPFAKGLQALVRDAGHDLTVRQRQVAKTRRSKFLQALKFFKGARRIEFLRLYWTSRVNYPSREEALFYMGRAWSVFRPWALELGRRLVDAGTLARPDDVFYVTSADLQAAIDNGARLELTAKAAGERDLRTLRFRMAPPSAIPPLQKDDDPYGSLRNNEGEQRVLRGFAVSPGTVTGVASVIMTPDEFDQMKPNSILVCPLTTPAWTQLFPHAIGLVTDIGSILAHGSIVAREYGIPAVLGVGDATQKIRSGQTITIDGDRGLATLVDDA
ncbi:MAG: PEP-utilizing enzyme [Gammaproteobacteria bacterium]|nr:PEP-utilizing enzyme [Gammaproteobacteria bacterium]